MSFSSQTWVRRGIDILPPQKPTPPLTAAKWPLKMLAIAAIFLLSAVSLPSAEALEVSLNEQNLLELINQDRSVYGLPALTPDGRLTEAAGMKAEHMLANDYFAHTSPQGVRPWEFLDQAGFPYRSAGENLALNYQNAYELIEDFMQSPSHRANLLSADFQEIGIAINAGELDGENALVAVFMFGKEQNAAD